MDEKNTHQLELGRYWLDKAKRSYEAAEDAFQKNNYDFCVNRLYYSAFYAVSAVLIINGKNYKKHSAVRSAVHRDFVKNGKISIELGKLYDKLLRDREEADYVAFVEFDPEVVKDELKETKKFINQFKEIFAKEVSK